MQFSPQQKDLLCSGVFSFFLGEHVMQEIYGNLTFLEEDNWWECVLQVFT